MQSSDIQDTQASSIITAFSLDGSESGTENVNVNGPSRFNRFRPDIDEIKGDWIDLPCIKVSKESEDQELLYLARNYALFKKGFDEIGIDESINKDLVFKRSWNFIAFNYPNSQKKLGFGNTINELFLKVRYESALKMLSYYVCPGTIVFAGT